MINELYELNTALKETGIATEVWHPKYGEIANITSKAPCIRIVIDGEKVAEIESVAKNNQSNIRRFGNNQGSFPAMNLTALYRVTDDTIKKEITRLIQVGGDCELERIKSWCTTDNWTQKFCNKYSINLESRPNTILGLLGENNGFEPFKVLYEAVQPFKDAKKLHDAIYDTAMEMLSAQRDIAVALRVLFFLATPKDVSNGETGKLSVVLDTYDLEEAGFSTVGPKFAKGLNHALLQAEGGKRKEVSAGERDAFGRSFVPLEEPMPKVKLAAGFDVALRTMFKGQPCQHRYGRIENATYPISGEERTELSAALKWLSAEEHKNKTWVSIGKGEAMFVFPSRMAKDIPELTGLYHNDFEPQQEEALFEARAKEFSEYVTKTKKLDPEHYPKWIRFFVLRKLDKARTKIVYSYNAKPEEIVQRSDEWQYAAKNLPVFQFCTPFVPYPLRIANILNRVWKQDGTQFGDKHNEVTAYFGMELFFREADLDHILRIMLINASPLAAFAGNSLNAHRVIDGRSQLQPLKETLVLLGMLLYWKDRRKDEYMNEYPYLFGQLLKASDGLHELYCQIERSGQIPSQLIGSSMYQAAMDSPKQTLAQLGKRLAPYLVWARSHQDASFQIHKGNGETMKSLTARSYLNILGSISERLYAVLTEQTRFDDMEKAQLFIGYLASFFQKRATGVTAAEPIEMTDLKGDSSDE